MAVNSPLASYFGRKIEGSDIKGPELQLATQEWEKGFLLRIDGVGLAGGVSSSP